MKKKILISSLATIVAATLILVAYDMSKMDIESLVLCSANEGGIRIPSALCKHYLLNHRINEKDIKQLSEGAGLDYILNLQSSEKYEIAKTFIAKGLDINGINHYSDKNVTPLHASVLYNDVERVKFLVTQGANVQIRSKGYDMTALELAKKLHDEHGKENRNEIIKILLAASNA
ncbi:ankyrin repeat domain-containing protein [Thalassomonas viridans]|uniref:Ankyrin repeat domain-containing protein n=1 Tax=Thalassomonas viridans TaxID=137584 RepID=A0AAE9Z1E5_9GAMM|nr:ankyrin repeat domain-containing protein [Thalassomonas viridans]WDE03452.1 ankyrin repeat domain-containing protein [Thalassomonas viridans]